ncbi:MAG: hypothetical protein KBT31_05765 [Firmicutes bacterium]|nr:hypothetical protein [Candidatus Colimorpha enterica]
MKKIISLLLTVCFMLSLVCSCAKEPASPTDDTSVTTAESTSYVPETLPPVPPVEGTVILTINPDGTATKEPSNANGCNLTRTWEELFTDTEIEYFKMRGMNPLTKADSDTISNYYDIILESLNASIAEYNEENYLTDGRFSNYVSWTLDDYYRYILESECIAHVTEKTTQQYGCGEHSHVFGLMAVEKKDDGSIVLTLLPAVGT